MKILLIVTTVVLVGCVSPYVLPPSQQAVANSIELVEHFDTICYKNRTDVPGISKRTFEGYRALTRDELVSMDVTERNPEDKHGKAWGFFNETNKLMIIGNDDMCEIIISKGVDMNTVAYHLRNLGLTKWKKSNIGDTITYGSETDDGSGMVLVMDAPGGMLVFFTNIKCSDCR